MKATTPKLRKKSTATAKKGAKTGGSVSVTVTSKKGKKVTHIDRIPNTTFTARNSATGQFMDIRAEKIRGKRNEPSWVRLEVKGLMDALSGR
ncbi:hypothetical protein [Prosthecobacter sp.]|uniref:hypothetical protein n=1 Tax=Prosthecobacter sp. TaxID=1965333 RepID=UPI003784FA10